MHPKNSARDWFLYVRLLQYICELSRLWTLINYPNVSSHADFKIFVVFAQISIYSSPFCGFPIPDYCRATTNSSSSVHIRTLLAKTAAQLHSASKWPTHSKRVLFHRWCTAIRIIIFTLQMFERLVDAWVNIFLRISFIDSSLRNHITYTVECSWRHANSQCNVSEGNATIYQFVVPVKIFWEDLKPKLSAIQNLHESRRVHRTQWIDVSSSKPFTGLFDFVSKFSSWLLLTPT